MKKNIRPTFFALPLGISDLKFKNNNSTIIMLGRLYCLWYKRKQNIRIRKKVLKEELFWFSELSIKRALQELESQNIIVIDHDVYKEERVFEIKFTDFFKNKISNYSEAKSNVVDYDNEDIDEIAPEDIEECDNEDIEEQEEVDCENLNAKKTTNADYNPDDDYLPVEGWYNTDRQDFRCLLRRYDGKVPEVPEEVLNFDFGKIKREDYPEESYITAEGNIYTYDSFYQKFNLSYNIKEFIKHRENKELMLFDWVSFYNTIMEIWEHLKAKGLV